MLGFLISIAAGFVVPYIEEPVTRPLAKAVSRWIKLEATETRALSVMIMAIAAGVAASVMNSGTALGVAVGLTLGYFATRIVAALRELVDKRSSND